MSRNQTGGIKSQTGEKPHTPGETLELLRGLKEMGVVRGRIGDIEFEFAPAYVAPFEQPTEHLTPEEYEEKARKIRKQLEAEVFGAS